MSQIPVTRDMKINAAKAAGSRVFSVNVSGQDTVYRSINRKEFRDIQRKLSDKTDAMKKAGTEVTDTQLAQLKEEGEEKLVMLATLVPQLDSELDLQVLPAGFVQVVSELIMGASGFGESAQPVQL